MKFRSALLAATLLAAPLAAKAQPIPGLYVSGSLGGNVKSDTQVESFTVPSQFNGGAVAIPLTATPGGRNIGYEGGFAGAAAIGWSFGPITSFGGPRVELQGIYLNNRLNNSGNTTFLNTVTSVGGTEQTYGGFGNVIWDFDLGSKFIYPYIGGGVGGLVSDWQSVRLYNRVTNSPNITVNNSQGGFAYQGILGAAFPIAAVPGLSIITDFRFESLVGHQNYSSRYNGPTTTAPFVAGVPTVVGTGQNYNYTFMLGVKYAFNAAPPPPPPAPAPAPVVQPARSYLVFFDWDKYNLTERARQIIAEAAANSTKVQYTHIQVNGFTDTSGSPKYNMGLSIRRANAVAAELVKDGVPKSAIGITGFGQTHLLVPTADGVREPQNRRVEIIIQ